MGRELNSDTDRHLSTHGDRVGQVIVGLIIAGIIGFVIYAMNRPLPDVTITPDECVIAHENGMGDARRVVAVHHNISTNDAGQLILDQCF